MIEILIMICITIPTLLSLYLLNSIVEYKETIKDLQKVLEDTRTSNQNLARIIQEEIDKKDAFEIGCG
jgi:hypothetical protein